MEDPIKVIEERMNAINTHFESQRKLLIALKNQVIEAEKKMLQANGAYEELRKVKEYLEKTDPENKVSKETIAEVAAVEENKNG